MKGNDFFFVLNLNFIPVNLVPNNLNNETLRPSHLLPDFPVFQTMQT